MTIDPLEIVEHPATVLHPLATDGPDGVAAVGIDGNRRVLYARPGAGVAAAGVWMLPVSPHLTGEEIGRLLRAIEPSARSLVAAWRRAGSPTELRRADLVAALGILRETVARARTRSRGVVPAGHIGDLPARWNAALVAKPKADLPEILNDIRASYRADGCTVAELQPWAEQRWYLLRRSRRSQYQPPDRRLERFQILFPPALRRQLDQIAAERHLSRSRIIRVALRRYLAELRA